MSTRPKRSLAGVSLMILGVAGCFVPGDAQASRRRHDVKGEPVGQLSEKGKDDGTLQLALGSVTLAASAALLINGALEIRRGLARTEECMVVDCTLDPPRLRYASAGLSFAFAVPIAVGGGLWLRQGVRKRNDARRWRASQAMTISPVPLRAGAGLSVSLRF